MNVIDKLLNNITMYKLVNYGLFLLAGISLILSFLRIVPFSPLELIVHFLVITVTCYVGNLLLAKLFKATINSESSSITAAILFFLLWPSLEWQTLLLTVFASIVAMASKFILAYKKKHIFNPAAVGAVALVIFNSGALWWIATASMLPFTLVLGLLVVRKIRRFGMFLTFLTVTLSSFLIQTQLRNLNLIEEAIQFFVSFPVIFFGTIMLTEPLTTPPTRRLQMIYASLLGILFSWQGAFPIILTTELVLIFGNVFSFLVSPKYRLFLKLEQVNTLAFNTFEFVFQKPQNFKFKAGQYLEWTLPMGRTDSRGNRRYFTIASAPTEDKIRLGVRFNDPSSSFKKFLREVKKGAIIAAGQLIGDFTLPENKSKKLVFIAGGIGITPFRSMIGQFVDVGEKRDIVLFYSNKTKDEIAYKELLAKAKDVLGIKVIYIVSDEKDPGNEFESGRIDETMLKKYAPDFKERLFYISGPIAMVNNYKKLLSGLGVKSTSVVTDYFPGF